MVTARPARYSALHLAALASFAIAQPLYDLLGRNAEFLVAHRAGPWTIAALVGVLSVLVPLVLWLTAAAVRLASVRVAGWLQTAIVGILTGLVAAGVARQMPVAAALGAALIAAVGAGFAYHYARAFRTFLTVVSPAAFIFPIVFVTATPVSRLVRAPRIWHAGAVGERRPPIVLVVFDELDTLSLLDANGDIDAGRYPNFAALARSSTWFPNAVATFPSTTFALPAILTGANVDAGSRKLPVAADYPRNLFTWLGSSYALHVGEPLTSLCAGDRCHSGDPVDARALASDVAVLYLHLITPRERANSRLPPLAFAWKGFTSQAAKPKEAAHAPLDPDAEFERALSHSVEVRRSDLFRQFVAGIGGNREPVFHFLHTLLPHDPYEYLRSGQTYPHGGITTGLTMEGWVQEQPLIDTGRFRHIEQVRFVDTLVGELIDRLKSEGVFDEALLIVTSDHGASFVPGQSHRWMTLANYREIVPAAMFLKLPRQTAGSVNERRVSGLDIVPTIADALGSAVPWHIDGQAMFAERFPDRSTVQYAGLPLPPLTTFDVREEARRAARARAGDADLQALVGRPLAQMAIAPAAAGRYAISDSFRAFESVSVASGLLPALVQGVTLPEDSSLPPLDLAIAVNGVIGAVTRTAHWNGSARYFSALVPASAFHDGANRLDVLAIDRSDTGMRLSWVPSPLPAKLRIESGPNGERLIGSDGPVGVLQPHIVGWVDRVIEAPDTLTLLGWAADTKTSRDLRAVIAFSGGSAIGYTFPGGDRPDVVAALGLTRPAKTGYGLSIRRNDIRPGGVRVFGLNADGEAGELKATPGARDLLAK